MKTIIVDGNLFNLLNTLSPIGQRVADSYTGGDESRVRIDAIGRDFYYIYADGLQVETLGVCRL